MNSDVRPPTRPVRTVAVAQISAADEQRPARAPDVANPAAQNLEDRVGDPECAQHLAKLALREVQVPADVGAGRGQILRGSRT